MGRVVQVEGRDKRPAAGGSLSLSRETRRKLAALMGYDVDKHDEKAMLARLNEYRRRAAALRKGGKK